MINETVCQVCGTPYNPKFQIVRTKQNQIILACEKCRHDMESDDKLVDLNTVEGFYHHH